MCSRRDVGRTVPSGTRSLGAPPDAPPAPSHALAPAWSAHRPDTLSRILCRITKLNGNTFPSSPDLHDDDGYDSEEANPKLQRPEPGGVASDFCFKLASVLVRTRPSAPFPASRLRAHFSPTTLLLQAADGSLASQPIALRALQQVGIMEANMLQNLADRATATQPAAVTSK